MSEEGDPSHDDSLDLVFSPNSTDLSLNNQHERVARLLRATITKVQLDLVFVNAFPQELLRNVVVPNALIAVAHNLNDPALAARIHDDRDYRRTVAKIPAQRVSNFRGDFKKRTDGLVDGYYGWSTFGNTEELQDAIDWLKEEGMYHYPCNPKLRTFESNKPFQHPIIESTFKLTLFQRPTSFGFMHCTELCSSSLPNKPDEKELPMAMVALVATSVYASLNNWVDGVRKASDFDTARVCDAYKVNIALLEAIKASSTKKYHVLMHGLFKKATGQVDTQQKGKSSAVERALQAVNIDAMADSDLDI
ncbi:hypothetical protein C8Q72DRAFT_813353 [Fomitopsis betulina]|nr:hypothetical protein C8Q72DRAFT_813353 [Fomitopsis betulina]